MNSKQFKILLAIVAFLGGFVLMSIELIYPRISMIWYGNILSIWAIDLISSLIIIAIGYRLGAKFISKDRFNKWRTLLGVYFITSAYLLLIVFYHKIILDALQSMPITVSAILFALIFMLPTMGMLAFSSPILIESLKMEDLKYQTQSSYIFGISTFGGASAMLIVGIYIIPYFGIQFSGLMLSLILLVNALVVLYLKRKTRKIN